jgi:hypothetical protein
MPTSSNLALAEDLAATIRRVAKDAQTEEDLRVGVEHALGATLRELGLTVTAEYEKTTLSGSADAVYGHAVIEYKRPGRLAKKGFPAALTKQIGRYLSDQAESAGGDTELTEALEKMIGIGLDGEQILFVRYSATGRKRDTPLAPLPGTQMSFLETKEYGGGFQVVGPVPVGRESIELFLLYLRSLSRRPLTPEALASDFGPEGHIAPRLVNVFYNRLQEHRDDPHVNTFFSEWERIFGIVYGEELGKAESDAPELASLYHAVPEAELKPLFFAVHTYYALLMKFLAVELASLQRGALVGSIVSALPAATEDQLYRQLTNLEGGGTFALLGINNFLEGDFFGWYLDAWDETLAAGIRELARTLADFEPATSTLEPESTRDLLKKLYQYLVPRKLRHDLGEYYTADWLAERLLNQVGYDGRLDRRLLDPGCGSGTFPILALRRLRQYAADHLIEPADVLDAALSNIVGFDINPLSVIAARTNYLLALGDLLRYRQGPIDLPVYMCDSILTATEKTDMFGKTYKLHTVVGDFELPSETVKNSEMDRLSALLESCVRDQYAPEEFLGCARRELTVSEPITETALEALYRQLYRLDEEGRNGLWARLLKNAFAPVLVGEFDFVVGNPPWVNWQSLSDGYREATKRLWDYYGLFTLKGHAARLGGGKKDLAMLFTYVAADNYLKPGGKLGFVITQTVFKTKGAGAGFRRFQLGEDGEHLCPLVVDDMSEIKPFPGVGNQTAVMVLQKGQEIDYPVPYTFWQGEEWGRGRRRTIAEDLTLEEVAEITIRSNLWAEPVDEDDATSPWMTARRKALTALRKAIGPAAYKAHESCNTGGLNGAYWIEVLDTRPDGKLIVRNLWDVGRKKVKCIEKPIEPDLVYPLLRGRDVSQWTSEPTHHIIVSQDPETRMAYEQSWMKVQLPLTYAYLKEFEEALWTRKSQSVRDLMERSAFYAMYAVDHYTFAPYKALWREQASPLTVAVVGSHDGKVIVPDHKLMLVPLEGEREAHYVCGALGSTIAQLIVESYVVAVSTSTHVLDYVAVPEFDPGNSIHARLAKLSQQAHKLAEVHDENALTEIEAQVNQAAAELWDITDQELEDIRRSLEEFQ